jgi:ParB family chromosome partitioning protein
MATPKQPTRAKSSGVKSRKSKRRLPIATGERGLTGAEVLLSREQPEVAVLAQHVEADGGSVLGAYRDPLGGQTLVLATLPLKAILPTPFQRDLSPTHARRLAEKIDEAGVFLDPLIVVRGEQGGFWTPNGRHRLAAAKSLGLKQITVLISPQESLAYRILALNTEKAHNLKDRSLEVIRMARNLAKRHPSTRESQYADRFEAAELVTLGILYSDNLRFAGGAYSSMLRKVDRFSERTLPVSLREREDHASRLAAIDAQVKKIIAALTARGFKSPYLRNYVVARINPVRFIKQKPGDKKPAMPIGAALTRMLAAAKGFKLDSVSNADLAWVAVGAGD